MEFCGSEKSLHRIMSQFTVPVMASSRQSDVITLESFDSS